MGVGGARSRHAGRRPGPAQTKELRFGHLHSIESPIHKGVSKAADEFAKTSGGRYKIIVFPSSQLGAAREMVAQVIDGTLDFVSEGPGSLSNLNKALSLFEAPFVARDWDHVQKMLASPFGQEQLGKLATERNMVHLGTFYYGVRHFTTKTKALQTAADVKGLKIRVPEAPLFLAMIRALEATPDADEPGRGVPEPPDRRRGRPGEPGRPPSTTRSSTRCRST